MLKFRAWCISEGKYIAGFNMFGFSIHYGGAPTLQRFQTRWSEDDFILEQYLSPQYCEGDIIKLDEDWFAPIVKDSVGNFCMDLTGGHRIKNLVPITEHYFQNVLSKYPVVGNIHEDGGLLK